MGLIVVPITTIALGYTPYGSTAALGLLLPLLIAGDLLSIGQYRKVFDFSKIKLLLLPAAIGIALGSLLLGWMHSKENAKLAEALIRLEIGIESIFLVSLYWWRQYKGMQQKVMPEPARAIVMGGITGISTTLAHAAGPIIAAYLLPLKMDRRAFMGTSSIFFFLANTSKLPTYYLAGLFSNIDWKLTAALMPFVLAGALAGYQLVKKMTDQSYFKFVYGVVFAVGWYLTIESIVNLCKIV